MEENKKKKKRSLFSKPEAANIIPKPLRKSGYIFCYLMALAAVIHFCIFWVAVNANSIFIAFTVRGGDGVERFSLANFELFFEEIVNPNSQLKWATVNTMFYFIADMVKRILAFFIAYFFYKKIWGAKVFRVIFFLPSIISEIIVITVFKNFIATYGPLYQIMQKVFHYTMPALVGSQKLATGTMLFYTLWSGFGATMLIFVGVMNRIPEELIEAGKLDGCTWTKEFGKIVIPLAWETLYTMLILGLTGIFTIAGPIMYFTGGDFNTYTLSYWIYSQVKNGTYNYPSAVGLFFSAIAIPLVFFTRWILSKFSSDVSY